MTPTKLNLGCGRDHLKGFLNVDIDPSVNPDLAADITKPLPFANNQFDEVLLQDVFEHLTKEQAVFTLSEIRRILKADGVVTMRFPNIEQIVAQFHSDPEVCFEFIYGSTDKNGIWGVHKFGYNQESIKKRLTASGFTDIKVSKDTTNYLVTAKKKSHLPELNLLIIQQAPAWGGAEEWMANLVDQLITQHKAKVKAITNHPILQKRFAQAGAKTINLPIVLDIIGNYKGLAKSIFVLPWAIWFYAWQLHKAKRSNVNLILMSGFSEKLLVSILARVFGIGVVWYEYGPLASVVSRNFYIPKLFYRLTKSIPVFVITLVESTKNELIQSVKLSLAKIKVVPPGVEPPKKISQIKSPVVGSLSRLTPEKGQLLLLKAWKKVVKKNNKARLLIAGEGDFLASLTEYVRQNKLEDSVEFVGFVEDKKDFYNQLSVFVFPSTWDMEGFGIVIAEALSCGLPVVAFDKAPANEIINSTTGVLADRVTEAGLAKAILKTLATPLDYKAAAIHTATEKYKLSTQASKVYQLLLEAVLISGKCK